MSDQGFIRSTSTGITLLRVLLLLLRPPARVRVLPTRVVGVLLIRLLAASMRAGASSTIPMRQVIRPSLCICRATRLIALRS